MNKVIVAYVGKVGGLKAYMAKLIADQQKVGA